MGRTISSEELFGSQDTSSSAPDFQQTPDGKRVFSTKALFGEPTAQKSKVVSTGDIFGPASHLPEFDPKDPEPSTKKANALEKMVWTNWAGIPEDAVDQFKAREPSHKEKLANAFLGPLAAAIPGQTGRSARENLIFGLAPLAEPFSRFVERPLASQLVPLARNWFLNEPLPTAEAPGFIKQFIPQAANPQVWGALNNLMKAYFTVKPQEIEHVKGYEFGKERPEFGDIFSARNIALGIDPKIGKPLAALGGLALRSVMPDIAAGANKAGKALKTAAGEAGEAVGITIKGVAQGVESTINDAFQAFRGATDKQTFVKMMVEQKGMSVDGAKQLLGSFEEFIKANPAETSITPNYRSMFPGVDTRPALILESPANPTKNLSGEVTAVRAEAKQLQAKADELAQAGKPVPKDLSETINKLNASIPQVEVTGRESEKVQAADKIQQEIEALKGRKSKKDIQKREELETQLEAVAPVEEEPEAPKEPDTVAKEDTQAPPAGRVSQQEPDAATEEPVNRYENSSFKNRDEEIRNKYSVHLEDKGFTGNIPAVQQIDNLKKYARLHTFGSFESYLNLRTNKELRNFLKENDISLQEFRDAMNNDPDYVPEEKPKTEPKFTVKKAELRPYRKEDGTIGYEAIPIEENKTPYEMGKEAFAKGLKAIPIHDKDFVQAQGGNAYKMDMEAIKQWSKGWHEANLAAPVPEEKPAPKVTPQVKEGVAGSTPLGVKAPSTEGLSPVLKYKAELEQHLRNPDSVPAPKVPQTLYDNPKAWAQVRREVTDLVKDAATKEPKTEKFYTRDADGIKEVFGQPVEIVDYLETFAHKVQKDLWHITEASTGRKIGEGVNKEGAVQGAKNNLETVGKEKTLLAIERAIKAGGPTPRAKTANSPQPEKGAILKPEDKDNGTSKEDAGRTERDTAGPSSAPANEPVDTTGSVGSDATVAQDREYEGSSTEGRAGNPKVDEKRPDGVEEYDGNYKITDKNFLGSGSPKVKFKDNLSAIKLLKKIESENRQATSEEQALLVKYVGWGGIPQAFDEKNESWSKEYEALKNILTEKEYLDARASTTNAHYTSKEVIDGMWDAVKRLGFKSGRVIEPGMGIGNFLGLRPGGRISFTGVELDSLTGRIAKQLYQSADIHISGFEDVNLSQNYYDLAISNVPFAQSKPIDRRAKELGIPPGLSLHDFFFAKALALVRPGGVVAFITSRYTMDKEANTVREMISKRADFLGAIRLSRAAFKANAGTEVITDIIFLRKRLPGEEPAGQKWINSNPKAVGNQEPRVNEYYISNPQMILGTEEMASGLYSKNEYTVRPIAGELSEQLAKAIENLPKDVMTKARAVEEKQEEERLKELLPANLKEDSYFVRDGKIYQKITDNEAKVVDFSGNFDRVKGLIEIRDLMKQALYNQRNDASEDVINNDIKALNKAYDAFVKRFGMINDKKNQFIFENDPDVYFISAQEEQDPKTKEFKKATIFTKRVLEPHRPVTNVKTAKEGLLVALNELGEVDVKHISNISGKTQDEVIKDLTAEGVIFKNPETEDFETSDAYLSGNVKAKLVKAKKALENDKGYQVNVDALEKIIPKDKGIDRIQVRIGAPWISTEDYINFLSNLLDESEYRFKIDRGPASSSWDIEYTGYGRKNTVVYGISRRGFTAVDIFQKIANGKDLSVFDTYKNDDGTEYKELNEQHTADVKEKAEVIKELFQNWLWKDMDRRERLVKFFNDHFNNTVTRKHDGAHLTFPGMAKEINGKFFKFRKNQINVIWRIIQDKICLLAHAVGAGKTFTMISSAMEMKRLGLIHKPIFAVMNSNLKQFATDFRNLYPSSNILVADEKNFDKANRERFLSKVATRDWDGIIITHSAFKKIGVSRETYEAYVREQINALKDYIDRQGSSGKKSMSVKKAEAAIQKLKDMIKKKIDDTEKDKSLTFEELGIDMLYVDEAQEFKNLMYQSQMEKVAGLGSQQGSEMATDLAIKIDHLLKVNNGKGIVFATGTPVMNTLSEAYSMMRYLQPHKLKELGISHFDDWAKTFGEVISKLEVRPSGKGFRVRNRFAKVLNANELMTHLREVWDIYTAKMLEKDGILRRRTPAHPEYELPAMKGGIAKTVFTPLYPSLERYIQNLDARYEAALGKKPEKGDDNVLTIINDGKQAAIDIRLVMPDGEDNPSSKLNTCIRDTIETWKEGKGKRLTQIIFFNLVNPKKFKDQLSEEEEDDLDAEDMVKTGFDPNEEMLKKWKAAGIPESEIYFIKDAKGSKERQSIFDKVNSGEIRILVGHRKKLGVGVNVQKKLYMTRELDLPWRPGDLTQDDGRIMRPGNENLEVEIVRYAAQESFDVFSWQTLQSKAEALESMFSGEEVSDVMDDDSVEFSMISAKAANNPLLMEKTETDAEVKRLKALKTSYMMRKADEEKAAKEIPGQIEEAKDQIKKAEARKTTLPVERPTKENEQLKVTVGGKEFTDKKEAGEALVSASFEKVMVGPVMKYMARTGQKVGELMGYTLFPYTEATHGWPSINVALGKDVIGRVDFNGSPDGLIQAIVNRIFDSPDIAITFEKNYIARKEKELKSIETEGAGAEFKYEKTLADMTARQREIDRQLREQAMKKDEKKPPEDKGGQDDTDGLMSDPEAGFVSFFPKKSTINDEIKGVQFSDPEVEKQFREANGMTKTEPIIQRLKELWSNALAQARRYPTLPNKPQFFWIKQILDKQGLIRKVVQDRAIRALEAITDGFGPNKLDLFTRKIILDDLLREAKAGRPVAFYSFLSDTTGELVIRLELLEKDKAMIDALIEQNPDVKAGVERRQKLWAAVQQDLVRYKILKESQLKEDYFRHQILEYAQTKAVHGTGNKMRTPNPGYSRKRMGSTLAINTNYLEAEMEVMSQAFHDIETAKNIEAIEKSPLNVLKTLQDRAKTYNATKVMAYFQAFLDREQALGNPEYLGMTAEKLYRRTLNWKQAMGYAKLGKLASEGYLPTGLNNEFQDVVESLAQRHDEGEAEEIENGRMFKYLNYLMNAQDEAGKMGAAMVFKGMAEKKQAIIRILGEHIKTWEDFIPEGYRTWQPKEGRVFYSAYSVPQKVVNELLQNAQPELGEYGITKEDLQKVMAVGGIRKQLVLPEEVADTLDNLYTTPQPNFVMEAARAITTKWKQWVLFNPRRFFKYNYQNFIGDSDSVIAGNPKIFRNTARAVKELENVFFLGRPMPTEMREFFERGGISSTLTIQEIPDVKKLEIFKRFFAEAEKAKSRNLVASIMNGYWSKAVEFTLFREAILRYAAYLHYRDVFNSGKVEYAASNPEEIDAMESPLDKAAKVATELLGDYANVSAFTQNMRQFLLPFASWLEVNAKRYYRLGKNAYTGADGAGAGASAGGRLAGVALKKGALGLSAWWLRAAAMTGLVMLYNQLMWGDEESEVSPYDQNRMHLILGRMKDGRIVILRGQGAFSDILEWFGLDAAPQLWREFFEGKASLVDIFGKIPFVTGQIGLKPVFQKIIRGITPLYKMPFETMTGRTLPVFDDRPGKIEDPVRNILKGISLENEYDKLTGRPTRGYFRSLVESFVAIQDPMENAYRYIQGQKYEYLEKWKGRGGMGDYYSPRSIVYRQYKKALVFKDKDAEERALAEIRKLGTTAKQFQSSMKAADPLYGLSKADKQEFTQKFLMPRDKAKLDKAMLYYKKTFGGSRD